MNKIVIYSSLVISLSACAFQEEKLLVVKEVPPEIPSKVFVGHKVKECDSTQRDLSLPWALRQYWCSDKDKVKSLQKINNQILEISIADKEYIKAVNDEAQQYELDSNSEKNTQERKKLKGIVYPDIKINLSKKENKPVVNEEHTAEIAQVHSQKLPKNNINKIANEAHPVMLKSSIIFARNIRVLGPQGRKAALALIPKVNIANNVRLRGLILPEEVLVNSDIYKEKVSVGRALAVRKLWNQNGVDIKNIKILHHNPDLTGRSVEVYIDA